MANPEPAIPENLPVGCGFRPKDDELLDPYLKNQLLRDQSPSDHSPSEIIAERDDVYKLDPWKLPQYSLVKSNDRQWFFFTRLSLKYKNSDRYNRATESGYWKVTGKDREIKAGDTKNVIGIKKTLVFCEGRSPSKKANWVIHEYHHHAVTSSNSQMKKTKKKAKKGKKVLIYDQGEPSSGMASDSENEASSDIILRGTSVLCRLMKKTDEKAEKGKKALIYDPGEPSTLMASSEENQSSTDIISSFIFLPEVNLDSVLGKRDVLSIPQESSGQYASVSNADNEDEKNMMGFLVDPDQEGDNADDVRSPDVRCD